MAMLNNQRVIHNIGWQWEKWMSIPPLMRRAAGIVSCSFQNPHLKRFQALQKGIEHPEW